MWAGTLQGLADSISQRSVHLIIMLTMNVCDLTAVKLYIMIISLYIIYNFIIEYYSLAKNSRKHYIVYTYYKSS